MSLTKTTEPSLAINTAYDFVTYDLTSSRDDDAYAVSAVADDGGGDAVFTVASHNLSAGDEIIGSGFTYASYNAVHEVKSTTATTITTYTTFGISDTGSLDQYDTNVQVGCRIGLINPSSTKYNITSIGTPTLVTASGYYSGLWSIAITTTSTAGTFSAGDLLHFIDIGSTLNGVHLVQSVDSSGANDIVTIYQRRAVVGFSGSGEFELLDSFNGVYPEKLVSAVSLSGVSTYRFNLANIIQSALSYDLVSLGVSNITSVTNGIKKLAVGFSEYFEDANGLYVESPTQTEATDKEYTNNIFQHTDTGDCDDYKTANSSSKFLTNMPSSVKIKNTEEYQLSIYSPDETDIKVAYQTYDTSGNANSVAYLADVAITSNKVVLPINTNVLSGSISKVDVWVARVSDNAQLSEKKTFVIDSKCYPSPIRLMWQNSRGGIDAYTFTGNLTKDLKVDVSTYKQPLTVGYTTSDRGMNVVQNKAQTIHETSTDFITSEFRDWLVELRYSNEVYIVEDSTLVPIVITDGIKQYQNDEGLISLAVSYVYANDTKTQRS